MPTDQGRPRWRIAVIGSSGHAHSVISTLERCDQYELAGLFDDYRPSGSIVSGLPVKGTLDAAPQIMAAEAIDSLAIAVGHNFARIDILLTLRSQLPAIVFPSVIDNSAIVSHRAEIGLATVVLAGAIINSGAKIQTGCLINTGAIVEHDCILERGASLAPGAVLGGSARIGRESVVGIGATVCHNVSVGDFAVIGAGSTVTRDIPSNVVAYGTPARVIRKRHRLDPYL